MGAMLLQISGVPCAAKEEAPHKMVMPGCYSVQLQNGDYVGWYFWRWTSKQIKTSIREVSVSIKSKTQVQLIPCPLVVQHSIETKERGGEQEFNFTIEKSGVYEVKSSQKLVLVLVPVNSQCHTIGGDISFLGASDDMNFETHRCDVRNGP